MSFAVGSKHPAIETETRLSVAACNLDVIHRSGASKLSNLRSRYLFELLAIA